MREFYDKESGEWKKVFTIKEICHNTVFVGNEPLVNTIDKEFADKYLFENIDIFHKYFDNLGKLPPIGIDTKIICPFCEKGTLILVQKKKKICEIHICHTGDSYAFYCSNLRDGDNEKYCKKGIFFYNTTWMYC